VQSYPVEIVVLCVAAAVATAVVSDTMVAVAVDKVVLPGDNIRELTDSQVGMSFVLTANDTTDSVVGVILLLLLLL
jgi:hypothetical protein